MSHAQLKTSDCQISDSSQAVCDVVDSPAGIIGMSYAQLKTWDCQIRSSSQAFRGDRRKKNMRYGGRMVVMAL